MFSSMSRSIHFISGSIPGSGPPDSRRLPCSGVSGRALGISPNSSHADYKLMSNMKSLSLKCSSRHIACNASSSSYRKNPDSSGQNKRSFSINMNNNGDNEERDGYEDLKGSDTFSSRNGPLFPLSANQKFQATATPGPREKEIIELFKKVQAQLRERAAVKEEGKKVENSQGKSKESETVDSLLKILRKHSVHQGKKSNISVINRDLILDQQEKDGPSTESTNHLKHEIQESPRQNLISRPKSSFRKKTPVPEIKFQPIYSEGSVSSIPNENLDSEPEAEEVLSDSDSDSESDVDPMFIEGNELDEISEDEISEFYENEHGGVEEEQNPVEASDLSGKKLSELRALAKSRGMKGYSKLKKSELIELLRE